MNLKRDVTYQSVFGCRQYKWDGLHVWTRIPGDIWRLAAGWPQPQMSKRDLEYYVNKGEFVEADNDC